MKKTIKSFIAIAATIATLVSCAKEVSVPTDENGEKLIKLTLIANNPEAQPATKTEMVGTKPYWSVGDAIGVSNGTSTNYQFTTGITAASTTASFTGSTAVSSSLYAYYPYTGNGVGSFDADAYYGAKVDLPSNQYPTATSFDGKADVMVAKQFAVDPENTTVENLEFARLGAIVKIVLIDKDGKMTGTQHPTTVSMTAESTLAGRVVIDMQNQELHAPYYNASSTVTANYTTDTKYAIDGTNATYLIVYPQTLAEGSTLSITASTEDYALSKDITIPAGGIELLPGKLTTLKIKFAASNISSDAGSALPFNDDMAWADNGTTDDGTDIGSSISSADNSNGLYTTGSKAYKGKGGLKLGTSSYSGYITTKELDLSGAFYILIESGKYGSDTGTLEVTVDETKVITGGTLGERNFVNIPAGTYTKKSKVTIATSAKRGYIYSVAIVSGSLVVPPVINVTSANPMSVANTAGSGTIEYTISNPTEATLTAAKKDNSVTWISNINCNTAGKVMFDVAAQEAGAAARSAVIVLSYTDAEDVEVTVNQAKGAAGAISVDNWSYTFTSNPWGGTSGDTDLVSGETTISWNLNAVYAQYNSGYLALNTGTNTNEATIKTNDVITNVNKVIVYAKTNSGKKVTLTVKAGNTTLGSETLNSVTDLTAYTFISTSSISGQVSIEFTDPNGGYQIKEIVINPAAATVTGISVEEYTDTFTASETGSYSFDGKVYAVYSDGSKVELTSGYNVTGTVDLTTAGTYSLTVSATIEGTTYNKEITITVNSADTEAVVYTLDGTITATGNAYASATELTQNGITWQVTANTEQNPWRIGGKNLTNEDRTVYSTTALAKNISKIEITHGAASNITVNSMTVIVSKNADFSNPVSTLTPTFVVNGTVTVNRPDGKDWSSCYYKIVYNVSVSGNTNRFIQFTKAEFTGK